MEDVMSTSTYRVTVFTCVAAWFLIGMHSSVVHEIMHHGRMPHWSHLVLFTLFVLVGCASLWALLRFTAPQTGQSDTSARAV
jgi:hypothetical protein